MESKIDPSKAIGFSKTAAPFTYTQRDVILYALGIGVSTQQDDHLKFLFENAEDFSVFPTYAVVPAFGCLASMMMGDCPGIQVNPVMILHGEQYVELMRPLDPSATLKVTSTISDIVDKGSGALIYIDVDIFDESGAKVAFNQFATFVQQAGGFGGKRTSDKAIRPMNPPDRPPDASVQEKTSLDQAALYRLSGDTNPLHLDPSFAAMGGFSRPILHGLASFGFAARHVLKQYANNDVSKFKAIKVRFSKPVYPGETLQTDMWKEGNRIFFRCKVVETGVVSLTGSYIDLHGNGEENAQSVPTLPSDAIFEELTGRVKADPNLTKKIKAVYLYNITQDGKTVSQWTVDLKNGTGSVYRGTPTQGKADCTMTLSADNFAALASGKLSGQSAFLSGKLKIAGNIMLSQKLGQLFEQKSKL